MLYNPKWEEIYTVRAFADWLAAQPRGQVYNFIDPINCAAAQYLKAQGVADYVLSGARLRELGWGKIVNGGRPKETFGRAARRAWLVQRKGWAAPIARFFVAIL
jgi:hypothetical protein